jgi:hypothetical protein
VGTNSEEERENEKPKLLLTFTSGKKQVIDAEHLSTLRKTIWTGESPVGENLYFNIL